MKKKTKRLLKLDQTHVWHPFTQMREWCADEQIVIERGRGNYLIDTEGREYIDGVSSLWVNVHGHRKGRIDRAIKAQIDRIAHSTLLGLAGAPSAELASRLVEIVPKGLKRVFFSDNGSTAVEVALKMSLQYWLQSGHESKQKFVAFTGAYHGDTFGSMSVGEIDVFVEKYRPLLFETLRAPYPYCYRCPMGKEAQTCRRECLDELEAILKKRHKVIAACIIEPLMQGAAGIITSPPGFFRAVRRLTKKYDVHLIADEVAVGFGRTGKLFACDVEKVRPDFLCLAKGITGGYLPLAATLTTERVYRAFLGEYDEFRAFFHGHTYTGNPLAAVAAIANLDVFRDEGVIEKLRPKAALFASLTGALASLAHVGDVRCTGLTAGVELVEDKKFKRPYPAKRRMGQRVCMEARSMGLIIRPIGDTIVLMPPLSITRAEIRKMVRITRECIMEITKK